MRLLHLFDASVDWQQRAAVDQLLDRLPSDQHAQWLVSTDARRLHDGWFDDASVERLPTRFNFGMTAGPTLRRFTERRNIDVIHAWGLGAAMAAASRRSSCALILHRFDPHVTDREARALRTLAESGRFAAACSSSIVQRRLVESGVPMEACVVLRPGVDFRRINAARKDPSIRDRLGLTITDRIILAADPVTARSGHERTAWSGHLCNYQDPSFRMVVYGCSPDRDRVQKLARHLPGPDAIIWSGESIDYRDLIAVADALVITPPDDVPSTPVAWAMAASCPIVGSAVYSVAEFIAHKHNGFLIKPDRSQIMATKIAAAVFRASEMSKEKEVARGQAYEVFSIRRFVDQFVQISENLHSGVAVDADITDPAAA